MRRSVVIAILGLASTFPSGCGSDRGFALDGTAADLDAADAEALPADGFDTATAPEAVADDVAGRDGAEVPGEVVAEAPGDVADDVARDAVDDAANAPDVPSTPEPQDDVADALDDELATEVSSDGSDVSDGDGSDVVEGGVCSEVSVAFEPCGGDVIGAWTTETLCLAEAMIANPFGSFCPEALVDYDVARDAIFTFDADGTYEMVSHGQTTTVTYTIPSECVSTLGGACAPGLLDDDSQCTPAGEACICTVVQADPATDIQSGTWSIDGGTLETTPSTGADPDTVSYCRAGDTLVIQVVVPQEGSGDEAHVYFVLEKL